MRADLPERATAGRALNPAAPSSYAALCPRWLSHCQAWVYRFLRMSESRLKCPAYRFQIFIIIHLPTTLSGP